MRSESVVAVISSFGSTVCLFAACSSSSNSGTTSGSSQSGVAVISIAASLGDGGCGVGEALQRPISFAVVFPPRNVMCIHIVASNDAADS